MTIGNSPECENARVWPMGLHSALDQFLRVIMKIPVVMDG